MPGIAGIIGPPGDTGAAADRDSMIHAMMHEPFYQSVHTEMDKPGLWAGSVRLGSERDGGGLFHSSDGAATLVLSGDLFPPSSSSPEQEAAKILEGLRKKGPSVLEDLNGLFAGVFADRDAGKVILFTDRFGMGRIYWHRNGERTYFASEAKSLLRVLPELRQYDEQGLGEFISFGCVLDWRTLFKGIQILPAGSGMVFSGPDRPGTFIYYKIEEHEQEQWVEPSILAAEIADTCKAVFPRYVGEGEKLGISLTGGLDTRLLMACAEWDKYSFPCYTYSEAGRDTLDVKVARKVAQSCGQEHTAIRMADNFLKGFAEYAERTVYVTDGALDITGTHEIYFNQLARELAPVRFTGNYGSEIFRGVSVFKVIPMNPDFLAGELRKGVAEAVETFRSLSPLSPPAFALQRETPWKLYGLFYSAKTQLSMRCPYLDNDLTELALRGGALGQVDKEIMIQAVKHLSPRLAAIVSDWGISAGGNPKWLEPLVRLYYEYLFKFEYHLDEGLPDRLARIMGRSWPMRLAEKLFMGRHKFLHYRGWFRNELSEYLREIIADEEVLSDPCFERKGVKAVVEQHLAGTGNSLFDINRILTLRAIRKTLLSENV